MRNKFFILVAKQFSQTCYYLINILQGRANPILSLFFIMKYLNSASAVHRVISDLFMAFFFILAITCEYCPKSISVYDIKVPT